MRAKHYEGMSKGEKQGGSSNGVSRPSRDSLPSALRAPGQPPRPCRDLGHGVTFTLSPSPPRITGNARHAPSTAAAPEAPRDTLPTASAERLDLDLDELSTDTDDDVSIAKLNFFYIRVLFFVLLTNILVSLCSSPLG